MHIDISLFSNSTITIYILISIIYNIMFINQILVHSYISGVISLEKKKYIIYVRMATYNANIWILLCSFSCKNNLRYKHQQHQTNNLKLKKRYFMCAYTLTRTQSLASTSFLQYDLLTRFFCTQLHDWSCLFPHSSKQLHRGWLCS